MTSKDDAARFIVALNAIAPYVPPMHMQQLIGNPICRVIEQIANTPERPPQDVPEPVERPKPHAVS